MQTIGQRISEVRGERGLNQGELAKSIGVSQGTISRIENAQDGATDLRVLSRIATALNVTLVDLVPDDIRAQILPASTDESFYAFCPNPFCRTNETGIDDSGTAWVKWNSGTSYSNVEFEDVNFCYKCGTELVKECPGCKRRLVGSGVRFCRRCGTAVTDRPTSEEWTKVLQKHAPPVPAEKKQDAGEAPDDIPF